MGAMIRSAKKSLGRPRPGGITGGFNCEDAEPSVRPFNLAVDWLKHWVLERAGTSHGVFAWPTAAHSSHSGLEFPASCSVYALKACLSMETVLSLVLMISHAFLSSPQGIKRILMSHILPVRRHFYLYSLRRSQREPYRLEARVIIPISDCVRHSKFPRLAPGHRGPAIQ